MRAIKRSKLESVLESILRVEWKLWQQLVLPIEPQVMHMLGTLEKIIILLIYFILFYVKQIQLTFCQFHPQQGSLSKLSFSSCRECKSCLESD